MHKNIKKLLNEKIKKLSGIDKFEILEPKREFGDYSTNIALKAGKGREKEFADEFIKKLKEDKEISKIFDKIEFVKGYINFHFKKEFLQKTIKEIDENFGRENLGKGQKVLFEFVSANPTGPLNVANGRAAAIGDSLVRIYRFLGWDAHSEYYVNDTGRQIRLLGESLKARYKQLKGEDIPLPENGYKGEYIIEDAKLLLEMEKNGELPDFTEFEVERRIEDHRETLKEMGVEYDKWIRESQIVKEGRADEVLQKLREKGLTYEKEGAIYFKAKDFGDKRDRVLVKSDGEYTYLLKDIAYHIYKFERGYEILYDLLGPDHIDQFISVQAGLRALGYPAENVKLLIIQWTTLIERKEGEKVKVGMSKREGKLVELHDLIKEVGKDAARFFYVMRRPEKHLEFDVELAKKEAKENPVYYVMYAYARIRSIFRKLKEEGIEVNYRDADTSLLNAQEEIELMRKLMHFPEIVELSAKQLSPHNIAFYLIELATLFHNYYEKHRVIQKDIDIMSARLLLCEKIGYVIKTGLNLLGIEPPEKM